MAKRSAIRVALDLETTGLHPEQDAILEIAAVKFQGSEIIDTFETFVSPGRSIPFRVQRLTGIKPEHVIGAPPFSAVARKLQHFLGDFPIVGHSIPFDASFLRMRGIARTNPLVDTFEMATVLLPSLVSYNLGQVASALGVQVPADRHRAMVDTILAQEVFLALHQRLQAVDLDVLNDLANLDAPRSWPLLHFFRQELRERQEQEGVFGKLSRGSLGDRFAAQLGMDPRVLSFAVGDQKNSTSIVEADEAPTPVIPAPVQERIRLAQENRTVTAAVSQSLEQRTPLLLEVTTGGHDYISALYPTLEWLVKENARTPEQPKRLLIACANQQNARLLVNTLLPQLQASLHSHLSVAYLAEHGGYLCTHRWFGAAMRRTGGELSAEQARGLAKLRLWTHETLRGERSELNFLQQEMAAWDRISSDFEQRRSVDKRFEANYDRCMYRRKGYCFVSQAEERVQAAQIVVTTHAGLLDDLSLSSSLLASIEQRLILDADMIEEDNIRWGGAEFEPSQLLSLLNSIGTELPDGRYQGLLALAAPLLRENGPGGLSTTPTVAKSELDPRLLHWFQCLRQARGAVEKLFLAFFSLVEDSTQQANGREKPRGDGNHRAPTRAHERADQPIRMNSSIRHLSTWTETEQAWQLAQQRLQMVVDLANEAEKMILDGQKKRRKQSPGSGEDSSVAFELVTAAYQLAEKLHMVEQAISLSENGTVYWLRMPPPSAVAAQQAGGARHASTYPFAEPVPILYSQIVHTPAVLRRLLLQEQTSTIFAGAALSVDGSLAFARQRLDLEQESVQVCSSVPGHPDQTLIYLPDDVPEPNSPQYQRHLDEALINLATALDGQVVALFTSHAALRSTYTAIKPTLEARNILVLGQGADGSPRQLWQVFQSQERVVILGTGSFWDSMDTITRPPACLFIARLPMPVLNDPPMAARAEQYTDQLHQLTVPMATLRVRRVVDRILWGQEKRNSVVLFDRRVTAKEYGSTVLHSLPECSEHQGAASLMPDMILDWLTGEGALAAENG
ncbi:exonuclease domain-containing protein [Dictyobacter arantiisoli]|uniref:DNA polymerase III subunit epsilon n=1 Tax=Dictyobacter arantiisoli TaxID=2014874 RepID=A0A5A5TCV7_9CHLR|nr:exonuclease domain-containing protein [Dictyobacter arantiisoli]GCF08849.1 DNA polymerase III subunit epsilon [Dictyobacter arantiisoli]